MIVCACFVAGIPSPFSLRICIVYTGSPDGLVFFTLLPRAYVPLLALPPPLHSVAFPRMCAVSCLCVCFGIGTHFGLLSVSVRMDCWGVRDCWGVGRQLLRKLAGFRERMVAVRCAIRQSPSAAGLMSLGYRCTSLGSPSTLGSALCPDSSKQRLLFL